jgi:hypothetical protein
MKRPLIELKFTNAISNEVAVIAGEILVVVPSGDGSFDDDKGPIFS